MDYRRQKIVSCWWHSLIPAAMTLHLFDIVRLLLARVARSNALPLVPNAETIAAIKEARTADLPQFDTLEELFEDLRES